MQGMAHSFLIFDFGTNEETAQQARHRIEGWRQGFRLDKKLQVKFDRKEDAEKPLAEVSVAPAKSSAKAAAAKGKGKPGTKSKSKAESGEAEEPAAAAQAPSKIRLIVRLDFSDHEKLSHQRWIERIPIEEPFKSASPKIVRAGEPDFKTTSELFDSLN